MVTVNPIPVMTTVSDISACVNSNILASSFSSSPSGATFNWSNSNTLIGLGAGSTGNTPAFLASNTGSSPITGTITVIPELGGCAGPAEIYTITVNPAPSATVSGGGTVCNGASATINISLSGVAPWNVTYTNGSTSNSVTGIMMSAFAFNTPDPGTYTVTAISDANCNGTASGSATVNNYAPINVTISGTNSICEGASTSLNTSVSGGVGPYSYSWSPSGSGSPLLVSPAVTTTYTVTASDGCASPGTATYTVTVMPAPVVNFNSNIYSGCAPLCINLTDASVSGGGLSSWSWDLGGLGTSSLQNPTTCFNNPGQYSISLTVTGNNGCQSTLVNTNMITVNSLPVASISAPEVITIMQPEVQFMSTSSDAVTWSWNFGDLASATNTSILEHPIHIYDNPGTYCATLTVTNAGGCISVDTFCVIVEPEFTFFIPNAFTPDGNGNNDVFTGKGENIQEFEMSVYDRWGELVFFTNDINEGWNGAMRNSGELCQMDVYVYNITLREGVKGHRHNYIGKVTLVK
jgi:gliding motility-associated-like protein